MNIDEFIKKWCTGLLDFDNQISTFDFNLNLGLNRSWWDRQFAHNLGYNDEELNQIITEEPLQHPIIAMQEANNKMEEMYADFNCLKIDLLRKLFNSEKMVGI